MDIIDVHAHAFPDALAESAIQFIETDVKKNLGIDYQAYTRGTITEHIESMNEAGITISVINSIATKPSQVTKITDWSTGIMSERIVPFASIHPDFDDYDAEIKRIKSLGIKGIKLHPYYQRFNIDDPKMLPIYDKLAEHDLIVQFHAGYDIGFIKDSRAAPQRILNIHQEVPELKIIAAHFGGYDDWHSVRQFLLNKKIFLETSFTLFKLKPGELEELIESHDDDFILFGTDSPWISPKDIVNKVKRLNISPIKKEKLFFKNARQLLALS